MPQVAYRPPVDPSRGAYRPPLDPHVYRHPLDPTAANFRPLVDPNYNAPSDAHYRAGMDPSINYVRYQAPMNYVHSCPGYQQNYPRHPTAYSEQCAYPHQQYSMTPGDDFGYPGGTGHPGMVHGNLAMGQFAEKYSYLPPVPMGGQVK